MEMREIADSWYVVSELDTLLENSPPNGKGAQKTAVTHESEQHGKRISIRAAQN